jgi:iron complex outermembrane receptor protein
MTNMGYSANVMIRSLLLLILIAIFSWHFCAGPAYGEVSDTEELGFMEIENVYAAAKHLQSVKEAPASITIVTEEDIRRYGHRHLTDVVNNVGGFYTYSDRNYDYIGVRGFARLGDYGNRVLQLIDGHTNNDVIYGTFFLGHQFGVDMDLIKRIEFIRGPGSALYGSNALLGTVNIVTKEGKDFDGLYAKVEGGSYHTYSGSIAYGKEFGNHLDVLLSASLINSRGQEFFYPEFHALPISDGWARNADGEKARKFLLKATFHEFSLLANYAWREKDIPTASFGTIFKDNRCKTMDEKLFAELKWDHPFDSAKRMKVRLYYDRYRFEGVYPYDYPPVTLNKDETLGQGIGGEAMYDHVFASHHLLVGGEVNRQIDARQKNYDESPRTVYLDDAHSFTTWSAFIQDEWNAASWLRAITGLRFDRYSTFGEHLSPRIGLIFNPDDATTVKLLYGQAFRAPNVYELYYTYVTGASIYRDNPDLKPETLYTYEIAVEQELTSTLKATISAFRFEAKDLISQQTLPDGSLQFINLDRAKSDGVELGLNLHWPGAIKGHVGYTYQDARDDTTGRRLANSPRHLLKIGAHIPLYRDILFLGGQCRYMGNRLDRDGDDVGAATVMDLNLSMEYEALNLSLGVFNLFDETYGDPVSADHTQKIITQNGRSVWVKAGYSF